MKNHYKQTREKSLFSSVREHKGYSLRKLEAISGISRRTIALAEKGEYGKIKLQDILKLCELLDIHPFYFLRTCYGISDNLFDTGWKELVEELVQRQITFTLIELRKFSQLVQVRFDDFDLEEIFKSEDSYLKLVVLNKKLEKQEITKERALIEFPPKYKYTSRRRN